MATRTESINWPDIVRPLATAERALGRLAQALETTPLHKAWLWRELTHLSAELAQAGGYQVNQEQLRLAVIGAPLEADDNTAGLGAAKRIFLAAAPLFREGNRTDSDAGLWPTFWGSEASKDANAADPAEMPSIEGKGDRAKLEAMVAELAGFADDGRRPALVNLLVDLRGQAALRPLPASLVRLAMPLALHQAGIVPKPAPGLLAGRRLPLGMSRASGDLPPLTAWLARALTDLDKEAGQSHRRLAELTRQQRAWHGALAKEGLRKHARAPRALDLLMATPVLSLGLIARHAGCSHVAAGQIAERLVATGILVEQTSRSRHKLFVAGDLMRRDLVRRDRDRSGGEEETPLSLSEPAPSVDVDALAATLDGLFADLDRLNERAKDRIGTKGKNADPP